MKSSAIAGLQNSRAKQFTVVFQLQKLKTLCDATASTATWRKLPKEKSFLLLYGSSWVGLQVIEYTATRANVSKGNTQLPLGVGKSYHSLGDAVKSGRPTVDDITVPQQNIGSHRFVVSDFKWRFDSPQTKMRKWFGQRLRFVALQIDRCKTTYYLNCYIQ